MYWNISVNTFQNAIKRVRLERSAWRLKVEKERSITEIGETYGYSSSNFALRLFIWKIFMKNIWSTEKIYAKF